MSANRKKIVLVDLSTKKKAPTDRKDSGSTFLYPMKRYSKDSQRPSFFRSSSVFHPNVTHQSLLLAINNLSQAQAISLASSLHLSDVSVRGLINFMRSIPPSANGMLEKVDQLISTLVGTGKKSSETSSDILKMILNSPLDDFRFSNSGLDFFKVFQILPGQSPAEQIFQLGGIENHQHIILQSFLTMVSPPMNRWPASLRIFIENFQIKPTGKNFVNIIDLSQFGKSNIKLQYGPEISSFLIVLKVVNFHSYSEIIEQIKLKSQIEDNFDQNQMNLICPMTGEILKDPGRGQNCRHFCCFDLGEFLKRMNLAKQQLSCPYCNQPIAPSMLFYSHQTKALIDQFQNTQTFTFDESYYLTIPGYQEENDFF